MAKSSRRRSRVRKKPAKATRAAKTRERRRAVEPAVPPHPFGWRGSGPAREPEMPVPGVRDPAQDEEAEGERST